MPCCTGTEVQSLCSGTQRPLEWCKVCAYWDLYIQVVRALPSLSLLRKIYHFLQHLHWELHTELNEGHLLHLPSNAAGSVPRSQSPLLVTNCRVPQTRFVCCFVNKPWGRPCSVLNMSAPWTVESSPHCLAFTPETFLCSHSTRAMGDTSVLLPAPPQPCLGVLVQDTLCLDHYMISKSECVD